MRQFSIKIFFLLLYVFTGDRLISYYLDSLYQNNYNYYSNGHLNYYLKHRKSDTLLLGSSRVLHSLNPNYFGSNSYLIAQPSKHIGWFASVLDLLEQEHKLPSKTLVLNIEPTDFNPHYNKKLNEDIHYLKFYYNSNDFIRSEINKASTFEFINYFSSCFRHNGEGLILITNPIQKITGLPTKRGFSALEPTPQDSTRIYSSIQEKENNRPLEFENSLALYYFNHIVVICKKNNIDLIILTAPFFSPSEYLIKSSKSMERFLKKKKIPYLNYVSCENRELNSIQFWYDNMHLNKFGAEKFSQQVKTDVKNLQFKDMKQ